MTDWIHKAAYIAFWVFAIAGSISGLFVIAGVLAHVFHGPLERLTERLVR